MPEWFIMAAPWLAIAALVLLFWQASAISNLRSRLFFMEAQLSGQIAQIGGIVAEYETSLDTIIEHLKCIASDTDDIESQIRTHLSPPDQDDYY